MGFGSLWGVNVGLREGHGCSIFFSLFFSPAGGLGSEAFSVFFGRHLRFYFVGFWSDGFYEFMI